MDFRRAPKVALLAVAALALLLTSCGSPEAKPTPSLPASLVSPGSSATPSSSESPDPVIIASPNLDLVTVTGKFGESVDVKLPGPWAIQKTQSKVLVEGTGIPVTATSTVEVFYHGVDGRTGAVFDENFTKKKAIAFGLGQVIAGFRTGLIGQKAGSRVLIGVTGTDGYDAQGGAESVGIKVGDTLIFVVDIISATLPGPTGATLAPPSGLPTVTEDQGKVVVTIPSGTTKPTSLVTQLLVNGSGRKVTGDDNLQLNYTMVAWSTGKVVKQTYGYAPINGQLSTSIAGWQQGLIGKTVGSRVLLIVPPSLAYPEGNPPLGIAKDETLIFVVDILFAQAP